MGSNCTVGMVGYGEQLTVAVVGYGEQLYSGCGGLWVATLQWLWWVMESNCTVAVVGYGEQLYSGYGGGGVEIIILNIQ